MGKGEEVEWRTVEWRNSGRITGTAMFLDAPLAKPGDIAKSVHFARMWNALARRMTSAIMVHLRNSRQRKCVLDLAVLILRRQS